MTYRQFTEHNDHEGEHWHFWLNETGNKDALRRLSDYLASWTDYDEDAQFRFEGRHLGGAEVDILTEFADHGYMASHQKVDGILRLPAELEEYEPSHWFYKGGITEYFYES